MIIPGLLTASTNKTDHFGISGDGLLCVSIVWWSFRLRALVFDLKTVFPPRRDVGTRVGARTHTRRGETEWSTRSEAESCASGLSWHNRPGEGEWRPGSDCEFQKRTRLHKRGCDRLQKRM